MVRTAVIFCFVILILSAGGLSAGTVELPVTGQTGCYDAVGAQAPCAGSGQDGEKQAGVVWPAARFAVLYCDSAGPCANQSYDCDGNPSTDVVTDRLTGLLWPRNGNPAGLKVLWAEALYLADTLTLCGFSDWRLPNINELASVIHSGEADSSLWLESRGFVAMSNDRYWSSTTYAGVPSSAWTILMEDGYQYYASKDFPSYSWPVRGDTKGAEEGAVALPRTGQEISYGAGDDGFVKAGVAWPNPRFVDHNNGTVTDILTTLMWLKDAGTAGPPQCSPGFYKTWTDGLNHVACLNASSYLGYRDWRLPNRDELLSLVDRSQVFPALPTSRPFINIRPSFWSATTNVAEPARVWALSTEDGAGIDYVKSASAGVWPVRQGQPVTYAVLTVSKAGAGSGLVTSSPQGISCGLDCTEPYPAGTVVALTAVPDAGCYFAGWSGGVCSGTGQCIVVLNGDTVADADFGRLSLLAVTKSGGGSGTVTSAPPGIDCGASCAQYYTPGATVTLTAAAVPGSTFVGWSGGGCSGVGPCTVSMSGDVTVNADFVNCTYSIQPDGKEFPYRGGSFSATVTASGLKACPAPVIYENHDWLSTTVLNWTGRRGRVKLTAFSNPSSYGREAAVLIAGLPFVVQQAGTPCTIKKITPFNKYFPAGGGTSGFTVIISAPDCEWVAYTPFNWIHVNPEGGKGTASIAYTVDPNTIGLGRSGYVDTILVDTVPPKKKTFRIRQNP